MKLTKYTHSCLVLEEQGKKLIIDPGEFTPEFGDAENVAAVVVTHIHPDHFSAGKLEEIFARNPDATLFTTEEVKQQFGKPNAVTPKIGGRITIGPFGLEFFGGRHAEIHSLKPVAQNISVLINDTLYYPGDSLAAPERPVNILAMPAVAPWLKMSEAIEFLQTVKPEAFFFRTHDALLSDDGKLVYDTWFKTAAEAFGLAYKPLEPGQSIEL